MRKKAYRAIDVKKINIDQLLSKANGERIVFGIDVAKEKEYCSLMNEKREVLTTIKWNHPTNTLEFINLVKKFPKAETVMEPSGSYGDPIRYMLEQSEIPVFRVSPKRSHDAAEVYDGVPSLHDAKSAAIISKLHLDGASEKWVSKKDHERDQFATIATLDILSQQFVQNTNRLEALMAKHWPEITKNLKYTQTTFLELVSIMGGPYQIASNKVNSGLLMKRVGGNFLKKEKIDIVLNSAESTIGLPLTEGELAELKYLATCTLNLKREIHKYKKRISELSQADESTKNISTVVGKTTAVVLVTCCGDPLNFKTCNHWLKNFGLNLKEKSSGNYKGRLMITRRGSGRGRKWLYFAVLRLVQKDEIVKAWYKRKIERDGGIRKKGLVAIMRKLVKALWYVARGEKFDTRKMFDATKLGFAS